MDEKDYSKYPNNSQKARENKELLKLEPDPVPPPPREKVTNVVTSKVVIRKKSILDRVANFITGGHNMKEALTYAVQDIVVPAIKGVVLEILIGGIETRFGKTRIREKYGHVQYDKLYKGEREREDIRVRTAPSFSDIIFASKEEAEDVLAVMMEFIEKYDSVTVSEFYEMIDQPVDYTLENYGWRSLRNAYVRPVRGGYILMLPRPRPVEEL